MSSLERLHDTSNQPYKLCALKIIKKVRSYVVMLNHECACLYLKYFYSLKTNVLTWCFDTKTIAVLIVARTWLQDGISCFRITS